MGNLLDHVVVGYENVEPVIVANVALRMNFILVGCRGTCKTTLARTLAQGYANGFEQFRRDRPNPIRSDLDEICEEVMQIDFSEGQAKLTYRMSL